MLVSLAHPPATACSRHFTIALQEAAPWPPSPSTSAKTLLLGVRTPCSWPESPHNKSHNTFGKHPPQKRSENSSSSQVLGSGPRFKEEKKRTKKRHFTNFAAFPQTTEPGIKGLKMSRGSQDVAPHWVSPTAPVSCSFSTAEEEPRTYPETPSNPAVCCHFLFLCYLILKGTFRSPQLRPWGEISAVT